MTQRVFFLLILSFTVFGKTFAQKQTFRPQIEAFIAQSNKDFYFAYLGEYIQNDSALVFFWPCILKGDITDEKIKAILLNKEGGNWSITEFIDPINIPLEDQKKWLTLFDLQNKKTKQILQIRDLEDSLRSGFRDIEHYLHRKHFTKFIEKVESTAQYFGAETFYFHTFFTDLIFKGIDEVDMEVLEKNNQQVKGNLYFRTSNHEYRASVFIEASGKGFYLEKVSDLE